MYCVSLWYNLKTNQRKINLGIFNEALAFQCLVNSLFSRIIKTIN